ncbi:MAG: putative major head protein [Prokaryotic dsDNA virus sp.]|nr:MAG: putative major head protein [Prokaryotic dsDNA virus sp.]|tara:strand:+ start:10126 stop:11067 length:942 start_codon:yes stop_codon:yes gene_type:complete
MASPNLSEIVTTTLRNRSRALADNVTNHNALLRRLRENGNQTTVTGRDIVRELEYAENGTVQFYSGYETLDVSPADVLSAAVFDYKQLAGNVTISGLEQIKNSGEQAIINLLEARIGVLEKSMMNTLSTSIYSDGTGSSGKEIGGLQLLVADAGTGTVGGINSSTFTFFQNVQTTATSSAFSTSNVQADMNNIYLQLVRGADSPDLVMAGTNAYKAFLGSLQAIQRITSDDLAKSGFTSVQYLNSDVVFDSACNTNRMYFLNTDYLRLEVAEGRDFVPGEAKMSVNQDAMVTPMFWSGNLTCSNRALQGVIHT